MGENNFRTMPNGLDYLYTLRVLNVSDNKTLTNVFLPKNCVVELDISKNPIVQAVDDPRNSVLARFMNAEIACKMQVLNLSYIEMTEIPEGVSRMKCRYIHTLFIYSTSDKTLMPYNIGYATIQECK